MMARPLSASAAEYRPTYKLQLAVKELSAAYLRPPTLLPPSDSSLKLEVLSPLPATSPSSEDAAAADDDALKLLLSRRRPAPAPPAPAPAAQLTSPKFTSRDIATLRRRWWDAAYLKNKEEPEEPPPPLPPPPPRTLPRTPSSGFPWHSVLRPSSTPPVSSSPPVSTFLPASGSSPLLPSPLSFSLPPPSLPTAPKERYPVHRALLSFAGDYPALSALLQRSSPKSQIARNKLGQTPLHVAVLSGLPPLVSLVLKHGGRASLETPDAAGFTPLALAAASNFVEIGETLLHCPPNRGIQQRKVEPPPTSLHPLVVASEHGHLPFVTLLLECLPPDPEILRLSVHGCVLHCPPTGSLEYLSILEALAKVSRDVALLDKSLRDDAAAAAPLSALSAACRLNNKMALKVLLGHSPPPSPLPSTPIPILIPGSHSALLRLRVLAERRLKEERQDALLLALELGHFACAIELLRDAGMDRNAMDENGARKYLRDSKLFKDVETWRPVMPTEVAPEKNCKELDSFHILVDGGREKVPVSRVALLRAFPKLQGASEFQVLQALSSSSSSSLLAPAFLELDVPLSVGLLVAHFATYGSLLPSPSSPVSPLLSPDPVDRCHQLLSLLSFADSHLCPSLLREARSNLLLRGGVVGALLGSDCVTAETAVDLLCREDVAWGGEGGQLRPVRSAAAIFAIINFGRVLKSTDGFVEFFDGDVDQAMMALLKMIDQEVRGGQELRNREFGIAAHTIL